MLPSTAPDTVELADLIALLTHPARGFLRQRLDVAVRFEPDDPADNLTVELDALQTLETRRPDPAGPVGRGRTSRPVATSNGGAGCCHPVLWVAGNSTTVLAEVGPLVDAAAPLLAAGAAHRRRTDRTAPAGVS